MPGNQGAMGGASHAFLRFISKNGVCEKPIVIRFEGFSIK